jgi:hypothetical protein
MQPSEIINADSQQRGLDPKAVLISVRQILKNGGHLLHAGNTALLLQRIGPQVFATHLFTSDQPIALSRAMIQFFHQISGQGIHRLYGKADNVQIIQLLQNLTKGVSATMHPSDRPEYNWMIQL